MPVALKTVNTRRLRSAEWTWATTSGHCEICGDNNAVSVPDLKRLADLAEVQTLGRDAVLIREGDPAPHIFNVSHGSLRVFKQLPDGRRQITGFLFAGDFLALVVGETYEFSAEAMESSIIRRFRKGPFRALVEQSRSLEHMLLHRTSHELVAAQNQMLLLGRKTAIERVASFLLDLPAHDPARPTAAGHVRLPMKRREIADYLGMTVETVSRVLTRLRAGGIIAMPRKGELVVALPERLRRHAEGKV
ncbi:helix-turn-helix domain-containing protein [Rhizobium sp. CRIBSB]|nr:helix-turn-helix domain-containing protein [Rhizobium sp. CRIBSB]